jgi:hypothetical protein
VADVPKSIIWVCTCLEGGWTVLGNRPATEVFEKVMRDHLSDHRHEGHRVRYGFLAGSVKLSSVPVPLEWGPPLAETVLNH